MSSDEESRDPRSALASARRVVVKIGSRAIVGGGERGRFQQVADQIAWLKRRGPSVALVSSGAVALGCGQLGLGKRPRTLPLLQAAAAVGQSRMMQAYESAFARHGMTVGQVLLTHAGMADRKRYINARHAIDALFELDAVPIINENDTVSTEEIEFGDNDQLAALVASLLGADLLLLLTDVEGLLDAERRRVSLVDDVEAIRGLIWREENGVSLGGMASKVNAAMRALHRGMPVVIAEAADPEVVQKAIEGRDVGTLFLPSGSALASRKYWIAHTLKMRGTLVIDAGAQRALCQHNRSLLPAGIVGVRGRFRAGDAVSIASEQGSELARGLCRYDSRDVRRLLGVQSGAIEDRLGHYFGDEVVHRDDLVVL